MTTITAFLLAGLCALVTGWSINHGGICAVGAMRDAIERRAMRLTIGMVLACSTAGLLVIPGAWLFAGHVRLAGVAPITSSLVLGAALLGLGAVVNDACLLGSLARLGNGELRFIGLPMGLAGGYALLGNGAPAIRVTPSPLASPSIAGLVMLACLAVGFASSLVPLLRDGEHRHERRWPIAVAMILLGVCGSILYAVAPGWSYADVVRARFAYSMAAMVEGGSATWLAAATVAGSIAAAVTIGRFELSLPTIGTFGRSALGGALMAMGAIRVPGGNDSLLLAALPSGSISGVVAWLAMTSTVAALLGLGRWSRAAFESR